MTTREVLLVDLSGIFWANYHATADQHVSEAFARTVEKVTALREHYGPVVAACIDSPPYFRKELLPTYKAQRDAPPEQAVGQLERVKERLEADGVLLWGARGYEADDIAATAVALAKQYGVSVVCASSDKDWLQLVDDEAGIRVFSVASGVMYQRQQVIEKLGVSPDMVCDWLALMGDSSDNVPGIPKVGPKTAAKLLMEHGSLHEVLANADKNTPKLCEALIEHAGAARLARKLVELRTDAPINFEDLFAERAPKPIAEEPEDMDANESITEDGEIISSPPPATTEQTAEVVQLDPQQSTALAKTGDWSMGLEPQTLGAAMKLAVGLANSRLYTRFPNAEAIWAIIIRGREMGLGALTALDSFHIIEGKPSPSAHLLIARCKAHPDCEYFQFVGGDATFAEYETKNRRNPRPTRLKYTLEQARAAGLLNPTKSGQPSNWEKRPDEMLRKTCAVQLGRIEYPEATGGLYAVEEFAA